MKQFNEEFYTDDFDQEMLDWLIKEGYRVTGEYVDQEPDASHMYLKYEENVGYFWTTSNTLVLPRTIYGRIRNSLSKQQFKEKIGMTDTKTNQERIFKLINKDGYLNSHPHNRKMLSDYGIFVDGSYYFKGVIDYDGVLTSLDKGHILIGLLEFKYFEEVPLLDNYFVKPEETSEENESLLVNSYINLAELSEEINENTVPDNETIVQKVFDLCKEHSIDFSYYSGVLRIYIGEDEIVVDNEDKLAKIRTYFEAKKDLFD